MQKILEIAKQIRLVIFDVDGVLTDGGLIFDESGREYKVFNVKDGQGIKMLRDGGVEIAVISARESKSVSVRMTSLGVKHVYQGQDDKGLAFDDLCEKLSINPRHVAYVGDDVPDLRLFSRVGLAIAVADAHVAVRQRADWCTSLAGGRGAAREVCDLILTAKQMLDASIEAFLLSEGDSKE